MLFLHHTAKKNNLHIRIAVFQTMQMAKSSVYFEVCILADSTGIVQDHICLFIILSYISDFVHNSRYGLRLLFIHLTAECRQAISKRTACRIGFLCS